MHKDRITELALANGFKLKTQPDGTMALNPYVFAFSQALLAEKEAEIDALKMEVDGLPDMRNELLYQIEQRLLQADKILALRKVLTNVCNHGVRTSVQVDADWDAARALLGQVVQS